MIIVVLSLLESEVDVNSCEVVVDPSEVDVDPSDVEVNPLEGSRPSKMLEIKSPKSSRFVVLAGRTGGVDCEVEGSRLVVVTLKNCRLTCRGK